MRKNMKSALDYFFSLSTDQEMELNLNMREEKIKSYLVLKIKNRRWKGEKPWKRAFYHVNIMRYWAGIGGVELSGRQEEKNVLDVEDEKKKKIRHKKNYEKRIWSC